MKKIYTLSLFLFPLLFFVNHTYSQTYGWFSQTSGTTQNLNGIYLADANTGYAVGQAGTIIKTTNGGTNWTAQNSGTPSHLFGIYFLNVSTGWFVGDVGVVSKTTNGGTTWTVQNSGISYQCRSICFINSSTGWVAGWYGTVLKTINGGANWVKQTTPVTTNLQAIDFVDANTGYAVGQFLTIIKTTDGGTTWTQISSSTSQSFENVSFSDGNNGIVIGEGGRVQKTTNGGTNWTSQTSGTGSWLNGMAPQNTMHCVLVGVGGTIRKTTNNGTNWYSQTSPSGNSLNKVSFIDTNIGIAVGDYGTIIKTTTGGWLPPAAPSLTSPNSGATCFSMTGTLSWGAIFPPVANYQVQISTDQNFTTTVVNVSGLGAAQYVIPAGTLAYNTLYYWRVIATNQVASGPWSSVRNFRTTNATPTSPVLVLPANGATGIALNALLKWDSISTASSYRVRVSVDSNFTTTVFDSSGITLNTVTVPNGRLQPSALYYWKVNGSNVCVTGSYSPTWHFNTASPTGLSHNSEIPKVFKLYNNYPNPFNPVTYLKFDIPKDSKVKIEIYDITGQLVNTIIDKDLIAGSYQIGWNAENYPSGAYIYRITADEFTDVKKMVLIK